MIVEDSQQKIQVKSQDLIIAQHQKASSSGLSIADSRHIDEMWRLTVGKSSEQAEKLPSWQIKFEQVVESRSLSVYEEVA